MDENQIENRIRNLFFEVLSEQSGDVENKPILDNNTVLLNSGLDSLGFAILVTKLEQDLGYDPFSIDEDAYYPSTYGEFVDFYTKHQPK